MLVLTAGTLGFSEPEQLTERKPQWLIEGFVCNPLFVLRATIVEGELGCSQIEEYSMPLELAQVAAEARPIFDRIQPSLLSTDPNAFVAIEPESGEHFVAQTLSEAIERARERYPERMVHTFRVGHPAAIHFGMQER